MKTRNEIKQEFALRGLSIGAWARSHGYPTQLVYQILAGRKGLRGKSHEIAVRLGLKHGLIEGFDLVNPTALADSPNR
ncbi:MAG: DNA-binding protein [Proteobacteria bacterium]|nr:DNA-binding protein [Pseudomonadota bacterium]